MVAAAMLRPLVKRFLAEEHEEEEFGWEKNAFTRSEEVILAEFLLLFTVLLVATLLLQFYVGKVWQLHYLPESGATMLLGMAISGIIRLSGHDTSDNGEKGTDLLGFSSTVFFLGFLPPIIYNSGYQLKRRLFFANMGGIVALAIVGTTFSAIVVGLGVWGMGKVGACYEISLMEGFCFGSLISATDPVSTLAVFTELKVDPNLFYLVFGESVLNDAIGITLFKTSAKFVGFEMGGEDFVIAIVDFIISFVASVIIGYVLGLASAWLFKTVDMSHHRLTLVSVFVGMVYIPFFLSETLQLSGIVAILFSAVTARRYSNRNIPAAAKRATSFVFELMAYLSETSVFLYLGLSVFSKEGRYRFDVVFWTLFYCILARGTHVYPLLHLVNKYREKRAREKNRRAILIPDNIKHMVFFAGLRGAVAYACANIFPDENGNRQVIISATMMIVIITIFLNGGYTVGMLARLGIETGVDPGPYIEKLKKQAKPYKFLKFEMQYIYPLVIKDYHPEADISSHAGSDHGLGASAHPDEEEAKQRKDSDGSDENITSVYPDDDDNPGDGIQLAKGFTSSSGPLNTTVSVLHKDSDALW